MKKILIIGATSAIAQACARLWAKQGAAFTLVARDAHKLQAISTDLLTRGANEVQHICLDVTQTHELSAMVESAAATLGTIDLALIAHGSLPDQEACAGNVTLSMGEFENNGTSSIALLTLLANTMEPQGSGDLVYISSVAGDRGRPSNYLYGSAKAAVNTFCDGLRAKLFKSGLHVMIVKPGFVDTPMTQGLDLPALLVTSPEKVAQDIHKGIDKRRDTIYTPGYWRLIMLIIRYLPGPIFKRLNL